VAPISGDEKQQAHQLIDQLDPAQASIKSGQSISHEDILSEVAFVPGSP